MKPFSDVLDPHLREIFLNLKTPFQIQTYLDSVAYVGEDLNRTPLRVMQDCCCHCLDGGIFAAVALRHLGHTPVIIDLVPEPGTDDDHVLAIFKVHGLFGAVAKSNYSCLRFREPVYRSLRELVMTYFDVFYNLENAKTLRAYTRPLNLAHYDRYDWITTQAGVDVVVEKLYSAHTIPVVDPISIAGLSPVDQRVYTAGLLGSNPDGLYKPH